MAIESKKRKLAQRGASAGHRARPRPRPVLIDDELDASDEEMSDEGVDAAGGRSEDDNGSSREEGSEEEEEDDEEEGSEEEEEEEEDDDDDEEEQPPSPSANLTFGQILKQREKKEQAQGAKARVGASTAEGAAAAAAEKKEKKARLQKAHRSSKHAPAELPARYAVKRGRDWTSGDAAIAGVSVRPSTARARDPRFFLASMRGAPPTAAEEQRARRNYAFLETYRDEEMRQLREGLAAAERVRKAAARKAAKRGGAGAGAGSAAVEEAEQEVAALRRQLGAMEARKRAREARDKAQAVLDAHKQKERELVRQGKTPYFLKRSEQKKRLLVEQFAGMTEQQVDKTLERRRKKAASRERREMPVRRTGGGV